MMNKYNNLIKNKINFYKMIDNSNKLPGYTGHVPFRNECIGLTTGNANRESQL